jgi:hypothetical protein
MVVFARNTSPRKSGCGLDSGPIEPTGQQQHTDPQPRPGDYRVRRPMESSLPFYIRGNRVRTFHCHGGRRKQAEGVASASMLQAAKISRRSCGDSPCIIQDAAEGGCEKIGTGTFATADFPGFSPFPLGASPIFSQPQGEQPRRRSGPAISVCVGFLERPSTVREITERNGASHRWRIGASHRWRIGCNTGG